MVAAVGLVIGPVLGGALVAIALAVGVLVQRPARPARLRAGPRSSSRRCPAGTRSAGSTCSGRATFVVGLTGLVLALSKGGLTGWNNALVIGGFAAAIVLLPLFVVIERHARSPMLDLVALPRTASSAPPPPPRSSTASRGSRSCSCSSSTSRARRASRRSWPGSSSRRWRSGCSSPRRSRASRPTGTARAGSPRAGMVVSALGLAGMTTLRGAHAVRVERPLARDRRRRLGHVQQPEHRRDDGRRAGAPPRDRSRRADDAAEHRRRDLDRVRHGDRDGGGADGRAVQDLLRPHLRALVGAARAVHREPAHGALGARRDLAARSRRVDASPRARGRREAATLTGAPVEEAA